MEDGEVEEGRSMKRIVEIIQKKPAVFAWSGVLYIILLGLLKWRITPPPGAGLFLVGGAIGIYFMDGAEVFFHLTPSPFRTILFVVLFVVVSFFIVTSSGSLLAVGLVLSLYLSFVLSQIGQWKLMGNLNSWFRLGIMPPAVSVQRWLLVGFIAVFVAETVLFLR